MTKKLLLTLSFLAFLNAQHNHDHESWIRCTSDELEKELQLIDPDFIAKRDAYIQRGQEILIENPQWRTDISSQNTIYIPVIFHVLYNSSSDNISAELIGANFDQINLDFQNLNPDGDEIPSSPNPDDAPYSPGVDYSHQAARGVHNIKFVGAQGELTGDSLVEGITIRRYQISQTSVSGVSDASSLASSTSCGSCTDNGYQDGFLNIYIAPLNGGLLGQAYLGYPESVVLSGSVGSVENPGTTGGYNRGRTLTHELGHNFTFSHVFAASSCSSPLWSDIPAQTQNNRTAAIYEWPSGSGNFYGRDSVDNCISATGKGDQFMNYMDYVYDDQMRMFSVEQALDGYSWAAGRNWALVANGVNVTLSSDVSYATTNDGFAVTVEFGETMTGFTESDLVVSNGSVTNFNEGDGTTFTFEVTAENDGEVTVDIEANSCSGAASGYANFASNTISVIVDREGPTVGNISITNLEDSQYIIQYPNIDILLSDFYDATSGVALYYVSVGTSIGGQDVLEYTPYSGTQLDLSGFSLNDYQQYFVSVYGQDLVGLNSTVTYASFYYFGTLLGDSNNDWVIDFTDYASFMSSYPGIDIAPVTGSIPYLFPNFDGASNVQDLEMFEDMWNWSISENGSTVPNYTIKGTSPFLRILNNNLIIKFPSQAETAQVYFDYDPDKYNIDLIPGIKPNELILSNNDAEKGLIQVEVGDYSSSNLSSEQTELYFSFQNLTDTYEFIRIDYSAYNEYNQVVSEGYNLLQTAPTNYRLSQSYPNPFTNGGTTIEFDLPATQVVKMVILDIRGRVVRTVINNEELFGYQSVQWDAKNDDGDDVSSGVYFYQIQSDNFNSSGKLVFIN
tara:strand:- start:285 stop:2822 length:2538 start_codon:yes stop_codon:yes gene_type:complete